MTKVKLASVGLGWWGKILAKAAVESGEAEIASCFARRAEGRDAFAEEFGCRSVASWDEVLSDDEVQGVLIATSHQSHRQLIEEAASAGKAVFVEKPLTTTVSDGRAAVEAAEAAGIVFQVGQQRRKAAANRKIRAMLDAGEIGEIQAMHGVQNVPNGFRMPAEAWRWDAEQSPLGGMTSLGVHKVDTMMYLAGPIASVFCFTRPGREVSIDEATVLAFEFESGAVATITTSFFTPRISDLSVYGTKAIAFATGDGTALSVQDVDGMDRTSVDLEPVDPVVAQLAEFARAIRGETQVEVDGRAGLAVVAVLEAAVRSSQTRGAVAIADVM